MRPKHLGLLAPLLAAACHQASLAPFPTELDQFTAAGDATVFDATSGAYALPAANLTAAELARHLA